MQYMSKLFYNLGSLPKREEKLKDRLNHDTTLFPGLEIKPINQSKIYELYYIPTMKTIELISNISKDDIILNQLYDKLPKVAKNHFFIDMLTSEIYSTNLLEGVKSSKEDLVFTAKKVLEPATDNKETYKFYNLINSYKELQTGNLKIPNTVGDVRKIYDEITIDGVEKENLPDGKLFRQEVTYIYTQGLEEIHRGITSPSGTEEHIINTMDKLLGFINHKNQCHELIKNAIFHYYFGYVHPFYDGNGRTARFISSMYIKEGYSWLTALSLSQGSNENKSVYLKAFNATNQISMQGELNLFVDSFLEVLNNGQNILKENLESKTTLLEAALDKIDHDLDLKDQPDLINIMKVATELHLFGTSSEYMDLEQLKDLGVLNFTDQTIRKKLNILYEGNLLTKISKNPVRYRLNPEFLEY